MSDDPAAKARALAALFSQKLAPTTAAATGEHDPSSSSSSYHADGADGAPAAAAPATSSVLGKRTSREEYAVSNDVGGGKRTKIIVPLSKFPDVDFLELLNPTFIRDLEIETNARISLRGKGVPNDDEFDSDEMYVLIQAESESALEKAANRISEIVNDPEAKNKQLSTVGQFVSPLAKDPTVQPSGTFSLSSALYANDEGFTMMSSAPRSGPYNSAPAYGGGAPGGGAGAPYQQQPREGEESKDIRVPQEKIGLVIGRGGETIKAIQSSTGVYLQVQKSDPVDGMRIITLKGTPYQIEAGEIEVNRVITSAREGPGGAGGAPGGYGGPGGAPGGRFGGPGLGYGGGGGGEIMQVPQAVIGLVIGARGSTIRGLEERTGAMIKVQKEESSQPGMRDIRLTGAPHAIAAARQAIEELANNSRDSRGPPGAPGMGHGGPSGGHGGPSSTTAIPVPTQTTGTIIGRGGEIIKRLQQVSGCRIQLSSDESPAGPDMRDVIVTGRPDQIEVAKREIDKIVATKMSGGNVDIRMIGASAGGPPASYGGGYNSGYGAPAAGGYGQGGYGGGYGGPPRGGPSYGGHNPYGPPGGSSGYGAAPGGYGAAPGGYGAAPHGGYGDHSAAPAAAPAPAAPAEEEAPVPPQDPQEFQTWWGTLSLPQQTAYYRKYYPEMLSQLQPQ